MPVATYQIPEPRAARVLIFTCACGAPACFGTKSNIRAALKTGNVALAGTWRCADCQRLYEQERDAA